MSQPHRDHYRIFAPDSLTAHIITINDHNEIHHLCHVLRAQPGQQVRIFNGKGKEILGCIRTITRETLIVENVAVCAPLAAPHARVTLACAIPKKTKFEWIVEKTTELGADRIIPLLTQRTEIKLDAQQRLRKLERYRTVAVNAAKQCGRRVLPDIASPTPFSSLLASISSFTTALIPCLQEPRQRLRDVLPAVPSTEEASVLVLIGPEGDFSPQEIQEAVAAGCLPVTLGENVLKVETAAISVLAFIRFMYT